MRHFVACLFLLACDGKAADAPDLARPNDLSSPAACQSFCACMATNCAAKIFPGGCLADCASQTKWDLPCRANMCSLVPAQPNNDHCTHAMGVDQCLDNP